MRLTQNHNYFPFSTAHWPRKGITLWQAEHIWKSWFFRDIWNWLFSRQKCRGSADKCHYFWDSSPSADIHTPSTFCLYPSYIIYSKAWSRGPKSSTVPFLPTLSVHLEASLQRAKRFLVIKMHGSIWSRKKTSLTQRQCDFHAQV